VKYNIIDIRLDEDGDPWFLVENYYESESWWLHLSDEYSYDAKDHNLNGTRYELRKVEK